MFFNRNRFTIKKVEPIITCSPWNPVAIKNVDPYTESDIENGASTYSNPWSIENSTPNKIVRDKDKILIILFFLVEHDDIR